jgi:hypothetical protein
MGIGKPATREEEDEKDGDEFRRRGRRKARKKKARPANFLWVGIAAGGGTLIVVILVVVLLLSSRGKTPQAIAQNQGRQIEPNETEQKNKENKRPVRKQTVKPEIEQEDSDKSVVEEKPRTPELPGSVQQGRVEILYSEGATRQEAERVAAHFAQDARNYGPIQLKKTARHYLIRAQAGEATGLANTQKSWGVTAARISRDVFAGAAVEVHLCDEFFNTVKAVPLPADLRYGVVVERVETFFAAASDREDAKRLAKFVATTLESAGAPVLSTKLARRGNVAEVHLVVKKVRIDEAALRQLRRLRSGIETNVFASLTVELHLCDASMEEFQLLTK